MQNQTLTNASSENSTENSAQTARETPDYPVIGSRSLNKMQRRSVLRVVNYYRDRNEYSGCTSVRFELRECGSFVSMTVRTRRSDCSEYSQRETFSQQRSHIFVGPRGGLKVVNASSGLTAEVSHVRNMLGAK